MHIEKDIVARIFFTVADKSSGKVLQEISEENAEEFCLGITL